MEPTINTINDNEPIDETDIVEAIEHEASEAEIKELPFGRGRGRRGKFGRRPFGPNRPYRFALFVEADGSYVLRSPDLAADAVPVGSLDDVAAAMQAAIEERAAEDAKAAEDAAKDAEYSGKFVLRLPRSMHRQLAELAETEGVSLNQLALTFLAQGMGRVDSEEELGGRRGPRGGHRGPGGHRPGGGRGRGRQGGRGPEGFGHEGRGPEGRGPGGHDFGRGPQGERPGFIQEMGRRGRRPDFTGSDFVSRPFNPEPPRLV